MQRGSISPFRLSRKLSFLFTAPNMYHGDNEDYVRDLESRATNFILGLVHSRPHLISDHYIHYLKLINTTLTAIQSAFDAHQSSLTFTQVASAAADLRHKSVAQTEYPNSAGSRKRARENQDSSNPAEEPSQDLLFVEHGKRAPRHANRKQAWYIQAQRLVAEVPEGRDWWKGLESVGITSDADCDTIFNLLSPRERPNEVQQIREPPPDGDGLQMLRCYVKVTRRQDSDVKVRKAVAALRQVVLVSACIVLLELGVLPVEDIDKVMGDFITDSKPKTLSLLREGVQWLHILIHSLSGRWTTRIEWMILLCELKVQTVLFDASLCNITGSFSSYSTRAMGNGSSKRSRTLEFSCVSRYYYLAKRKESCKYVAQMLEDPKFFNDFENRPEWPSLKFLDRVYDLLQTCYPTT